MYKMALAILTLALLAAAPKRPEIVTIKTSDAIKIAVGGKGEFPLDLKILKGYHIQANPASEPHLIATTVKVEPGEGFTAMDPVFPKGIPFKIKGSEKEISTYEEELQFRIPLQADESAAVGERTFKGTIRYQGCNATTCFPPTTIPFEARIVITK